MCNKKASRSLFSLKYGHINYCSALRMTFSKERNLFLWLEIIINNKATMCYGHEQDWNENQHYGSISKLMIIHYNQ